MREIELVGGLIALVDNADFELVSTFRWYKHQPPRSKTPYAKVNPKQGNVLLHRLILGFPSYHIDHKNGNGLDCQRSNLRPATKVQQAANSFTGKRGGASMSKYKGVHRHYTGKWVARIHIKRKAVHLGMFRLEENAAQAYNFAAEELFREY